jgi:hypothetical protein
VFSDCLTRWLESDPLVPLLQDGAGDDEVSSRLAEALSRFSAGVEVALSEAGVRSRHRLASVSHGGESTEERKARARKTAVQPLSVPDGTRWETIIIEFVNPEALRIRARGFEENRTFEELGFHHRGKKHAAPRPLWALLHLLAKQEGRIQWGVDNPFDPDSRPNIKKQISDLRRHLKSLFPNVPGDPFKSYRKVRGYETVLRIQLAPNYTDASR